MVEKIYSGEEFLGLIIRNDYSKEGVSFFTSNDSPQQIAFMKHSSGKEIAPHVHNAVKREILYTSEVLMIKKGSIRVDFYSSTKVYLESRIIKSGDVILLAGGGHGFQMIDEVEMIEVKQGPYLGEEDKVRFNPVSSSELKLK